MYNAGSTIIQTLEGLEKQSYQNFEVILVDDGSKDDTISRINKFKKKSDLHLSVSYQENAGPAKARNNGAYTAKGEILIFTDADCIPPKNWIEEMIKPIGGEIVGAHCGYDVKNKNSLVARYIDYEIKKRHYRLYRKIIDSVGTYSFSIKKDVFNKMGGFDSSYKTASGEDFAFSYKLSENNFKIYFTDKTFVYHFHLESFLKYLKQQFYRGFWRIPLYLDNKSKITSGDSYSGYEAQIQFFAVGFLLLSFIGMYYILYLPLVFLFILYLSNINYGIFSYKYEKKMIIIAPFLASLRSLSGFFGATSGLISFWRK